MNDCTCVKEMLLSFVYTDAERERENHKERVTKRKETKGRREKMEIEGTKKEQPVCVLVGGN